MDNEHQLGSTSFSIWCFITFWSLVQTRMKHWHILFIRFKTANIIWKAVSSLVSKASPCSFWFCFLGQGHTRTWEAFLTCIFRIITFYSAGVWTQSLTHAKLSTELCLPLYLLSEAWLLHSMLSLKWVL